MTDWIPFHDGLPNVIVKELEIHYAKGTISAATFGWGIWESPLDTLPGINLSNNLNNLNFSIFPNPAKREITIRSNAKNISIRIFSLTGKKLLETTSRTISLNKLAKGCYIIEVTSNGVSERDKLAIK